MHFLLWGRGAPSMEVAKEVVQSLIRRHQTCDFSKHTTSAPAELGGEIHNVLRNRARMQVLLQARKLHVYASGTFGAFWDLRESAGGRGFCEHRSRKNPKRRDPLLVRAAAEVRGQRSKLTSHAEQTT